MWPVSYDSAVYSAAVMLAFEGSDGPAEVRASGSHVSIDVFSFHKGIRIADKLRDYIIRVRFH